MRLQPALTVPTAAHGLRCLAALRESSIPGRLSTRHELEAGVLGVPGSGLHDVRMGGVEVLVPGDRLEEARAVLADFAQDADPTLDPMLLVPAASFEDPLEAHAAAARLQQHGITHSLGGDGAFGEGLGVDLLVHVRDLDAARAALG
jgi:hypothetical protein